MKIDNVKVICNNCNNAFSISNFEIVDQASYDNGDYRMGVEMEYRLSASGCCPKCGNEINITGTIWEYPKGCLNDSDFCCEGAVIDQEPNVEFFENDQE